MIDAIQMREPNADRNYDLYMKRESDEKKWTFANLANYFHLSEPTCFEIYHREKLKRNSGKFRVPKTIAQNYPKLIKKRPVGLYTKR